MIIAQNIVKKYDDYEALCGLNMNVPDGVIYGLVGPNGSGKTTLIKHLAGIYKQDSGTITINNQNIYDNEKVKEKIVYVSDDLYFFHNHTVLEIAKFYASIYKSFDFNKFNDLKKVFNIDVKRKVNKLSKGMKKQVAFWVTISCNPEVMLLDEPIDGLDPIMKKKVWDILLHQVKKNNITVLISSHNLKELEDVCNYIGIIKQGKMILEKNLGKVDMDVHKVQVAFKEPVDYSKEDLEILQIEKSGSIDNLIVKGEKDKIQEKLNKHNPLVLDFIPLTLEEVFIYEVGGDNL